MHFFVGFLLNVTLWSQFPWGGKSVHFIAGLGGQLKFPSKIIR